MLRSVVRCCSVALFCLVASGRLLSQTPPASNDPVYTLHANSRLVLTDVTVTDRAGHPVHNLPATAFHMYEGKTPQEIASFEEHKGLAYSPTNSGVAPPKGVYSNDFLLHAPPVLNIIVLDLTNLGLEDQMYLSFQLSLFLKHLPEGEPLAIYERDGAIGVFLQSFTTDHGLLVKALHRGLPRFPPRGAEYLSDIDTLRQVSAYLGEMPGRKNLLWFSGGSAAFLVPDATQYQDSESWRRLYDSLEANRIAVYPIDARGLVVASDFGSPSPVPSSTSDRSATAASGISSASTGQHGLMNEVAEATGGRAIYNNNGLEQAAVSVTTNGAEFYSLTYSPRNYKQDRKWHKVRVTLDSPEYTLSYRRGYFADGVNTDLAKAHGSGTRMMTGGGDTTPVEDGRVAPIIFRARVVPTSELASAPPVAGSAAPAKLKRGTTPYSVRYAVPVDAVTVTPVAGAKTVKLLVAAFAFSPTGTILERHVERFTLAINEESFRAYPHAELPLNQNLQLGKGDVYLFLAIVDEVTGRTGELQIAMQVPAAPKQRK